ncbi:hypothetical protein H311_01224, partial [Anncaliia algerae PRA109]
VKKSHCQDLNAIYLYHTIFIFIYFLTIIKYFIAKLHYSLLFSYYYSFQSINSFLPIFFSFKFIGKTRSQEHHFQLVNEARNNKSMFYRLELSKIISYKRFFRCLSTKLYFRLKRKSNFF